MVIVGIKVTKYNTIITASSTAIMGTSHTSTPAFTSTFVTASAFNCSCSSLRIYRSVVFMAFVVTIKKAIEYCTFGLFSSPRLSYSIATV